MTRSWCHGGLHGAALCCLTSFQLCICLTRLPCCQVAVFLKQHKAGGSEGWQLPAVRHAPGFERYSDSSEASSFAHEAG